MRDQPGDAAASGLLKPIAPHVGWVGPACFIAMLALAALLPVYTDEIGWRFQNHAGYAPGLDMSVMDQCGANAQVRPPLFMLPVRWWSAALNTLLPFHAAVRAEGLACCAVWAALFWRLIAGEATGPARRDLRGIAFAALSLGLLPLAMAMSRPELPLISALTAAILLVLRDPARSAGAAWRRAAAVLACGVLALSWHLKGVLYAPLIAVCLALAARGRATRVPRIVALALFAGLTLIAARYWVDRFRCPADPVNAAAIARENLTAMLFSGHFQGALARMGRNLLFFPLYFIGAGPLLRPMSSWIPPQVAPLWLAATVCLTMAAVWIGALIAVGGALVGHARRARAAAMFEPRFVLPLVTVALMVVWCAMQNIINVYEATHIVPLLAVMFVLALRLSGPSLRAARALAALAPSLALLALLNLAAMSFAYGPRLLRTLGEEGAPQAQPFSVSLGQGARLRADIAAAERAAGLPLDRPLRRPLLDDTTYLALQQSILPLHALGLFGPWRGAITDPVAYLRARGSDGVITECRDLPPRLAAIAARSGKICAIGRPALDALAKTGG